MSNFKFGKVSEEKMIGLHPDLIWAIRETLNIGIMDFSVVEGLRSKERQKQLLDTGATKTMNSMHLIQPDGYGHAADLYPSPINMIKVKARDPVEISRFGVLAGTMKAVAKQKGISITWGYDWDNDGETLDHSFNDAPHFELTQKKG